MLTIALKIGHAQYNCLSIRPMPIVLVANIIAFFSAMVTLNDNCLMLTIRLLSIILMRVNIV